MRGDCYVWDETQGKRGANEICSCLYEYVSRIVTTKPGSAIILYTENCGAQQKNQFLMALYIFMLQKLEVSSILHKFLVKGHTQNLCDNVHSVIEQNVTRLLKGGPIYTPEGSVTAIKGVKEMEFDMFFDLKQLAKDISINMAKVKIKICATKVEKSLPNTIFYKTSYSMEEWEEAVVIKKTKTFENIKLQPAYSKRPGLDQATKHEFILH